MSDVGVSCDSGAGEVVGVDCVGGPAEGAVCVDGAVLVARDCWNVWIWASWDMSFWR